MRMVLAAALLTSIAIPSTAVALPAATTATVCTHDVSAVSAGQHKCLGPGEYCKSYDARDYLRYGFECVGDPARLRYRR
jgi:hypothetical protein